MKPPCPDGKLCAAVHDECESGCIEQRWLNMTDIREALDYREVWFIFSPRDESWANIRIATFTRAVNAPHTELVVIHNEIAGRIGVRVWDDIVQSEGWFKVKPIEIPTPAEVLAASIRAKETP